MVSEKVSISVDDGFFDAYVSLPPQGDGPGLLLIQEIFGVNQHMRDVADRLAAEGFIVMVPDLFWRMKRNLELGYEGADFDKALEYFQQFDEKQGLAQKVHRSSGHDWLLSWRKARLQAGVAVQHECGGLLLSRFPG